MAVLGNPRPLIRLGHPTLRLIARDLSVEEIASIETVQLVADMRATLKEIGGIGLAAPQIAASVRVVILDVPEARAGVAIFRTLFNAHMTYPDKNDKIEMWEGCLSVPGLRGRTKRFNKVSVKFQDEHGQSWHAEATGYIAGVFQHEIEHLDGRLYTESLVDPTSLYFREEWDQYRKNDPGITSSGTVTFIKL